MIDVFLSRPNRIGKSFEKGLQTFLHLLKNNGLNPRTIGTTDYGITPPLTDVVDLMNQCKGAIILGYPQLIINNGTYKDKNITKQFLFPTEWNHIEAGLAFSKKLPLLVIHQTGIKGGVFDKGALPSFIFEENLKKQDWAASEKYIGAIETFKISIEASLTKNPSGNNPDNLSTDDVYSAYSNLTNQDDLLAWVATWPAFPDSDKENILLECKANRIVIIGPIERMSQLPGIFWRLEINAKRVGLGMKPLFLYAKNLPSLKMIIAGQRAFLAREPEGRTSNYYEIKHASNDLTSHFISDIEGARSIEDGVYLFTLRRLSEGMSTPLNLNLLMQAWDNDLTGGIHPPEAHRYKPEWVEELFQKWFPKCIEMTTQQRGWNALQLHFSEKNVFKIKKNPDGKYLEKSHQKYLNIPKTPLEPFIHKKNSSFKLRIVLTNHCDLGCSYCPPENEDFSGGAGSHTLGLSELSTLIKAAFRSGFTNFSITGGEPMAPEIAGDTLVECLQKIHHEALSNNARFAIQTNGRHLKKYLKTLIKMNKIISFKVSLDSMIQTQLIAKSLIVNDVLDSISMAKSLGFQVGINFVLTKDSAEHLLKISNWCRKEGVYLKILDLNWYADIGQRKSGLGAKHGILSSDLYWAENYLSPLEFFNKYLKSENGELRNVQMNLGIPMLETDSIKGFFLRLKDSAMGAHYSTDCRLCTYFIDRRRCQEGIYEPWITPGLRMKICRHRPDIFMDLSDPVKNNNLNEISKRMEEMVNKYYRSAEYISLNP